MVQNAKVDVDRIMAILMVEEDLTVVIVEAVIVEVVIEINFHKKINNFNFLTIKKYYIFNFFNFCKNFI